MAGIKETLEALDFGISFGNTTGKVLQDGKFDLFEIAQYIESLTKFPAAVEGAGLIPEELKDLTPEEAAEVVEFFKTKLDLPQETLEEAVEDHLALIAAMYLVVKKYYWKPAA